MDPDMIYKSKYSAPFELRGECLSFILGEAPSRSVC